MSFIVVAFFTDNAIYNKHAHELLASLKEFKIPFDMKQIENQGSWQKNTQYKPTFIKEMLVKYPEHSIVYTDIDSVFKSYPILFENISKDIAAVMSRTSFYSMYHSILGETERLLFQYMVKHNTITKSLEAPLNTFLASNKRPNTPGSVASTFASGNAFIYRRGHKTGSGPKIKAWLKSIIHGYKAGGKRIRTDRLSPPKKGSAAMGRHEAGAEPGDENIVRFELRYSQTLFGGQNQPASNWVTYAEKLFKWAAARGDTPDNPATPDVNEAAKTGLKE